MCTLLGLTEKGCNLYAKNNTNHRVQNNFFVTENIEEKQPLMVGILPVVGYVQPATIFNPEPTERNHDNYCSSLILLITGMSDYF